MTGPDPSQYPPNQPPQWGQQPPNQPPPPQWGQQPYPSTPPPAYGGQPSYGSPYPVGGTQPADLLIRIAARLLDALILVIPLWIVGVIVGLVLGTIGAVLWQIVMVAVFFAYFGYFESTKGQTLGKQILNLRVVGPNGGNPTMEQALKRNFFLAVGLLGLLGLFLPLGLSFLLWLVQLGVVIWVCVTIAQSPDKQGFHDKFAGNFHVVKTA